MRNTQNGLSFQSGAHSLLGFEALGSYVAEGDGLGSRVGLGNAGMSAFEGVSLLKRWFLIACTALVVSPAASMAFWWGLSEKEQQICERRASRERTDFSAKQAYERCSRTIRKELEDKARKEEERRIRQAEEEAHRVAEEKAKKKHRDQAKYSMQPRCHQKYLDWGKLEITRIKLFDGYRYEQPIFARYMRLKYGGEWLKMRSNQYEDSYPAEDLKDFYHVKWYGGQVKAEDRLLRYVGGEPTKYADKYWRRQTAKKLLTSNCRLK